MKFNHLRHFVVDVETEQAVAAFLDSFTAHMWQLEYEGKTGRTLEVREFSTLMLDTLTVR
jgi:hypothetical protein